MFLKEIMIDSLNSRDEVIGSAVCLPTIAWTLKQKKRSLWYIAIAFIPFAWVVFLIRGNSETNKAKGPY